MTWGNVETLVKIGEVIEASGSQFVAQCYKLHQPPPLGSLVKTKEGSIEIYGVVFNAETHSLEPGRRPIARGSEEPGGEDVFQANPQLAKLLTTDFGALVVGYREGGELCHYLPPRPACIHSFVYLCPLEEVEDFSHSLDFLPLLVETNLPMPVDEVIAACFRYFSQAHADRRTFLVKAGKELALLLGGELKRLNSILRKLK